MHPFKIVVGLAVFLLALPSVAEEIVYFKSGQSMPIRSHEIVDGMVHVDLGDNSMVAFPESSIDRIEVAGKTVNLNPSYGTTSNRRVPTPQGSYPSQNVQRPRNRVELSMDHSKASPIETDPRTGLAVYRPQGHSSARNRRQMSVTGNMRILANNPTRQGDGSTFTGTTQVGSRHVIGSVTPRRNGAANPNIPQPVAITLNPGVGTRSAATTNSGSGARNSPPQDDSDNR